MTLITLKGLKKFISVYWDYLVIIGTPLLLLPMLYEYNTDESRCGYIIIIMAIYWITDVVHLAAVSLIPVFAFPLMGILNSEDVSQVYMNDANVVFLSSLIAGVALESSGIHKRIAIIILMKIGTSPRLLLLGIMLATMCLSTWIMDIASCAMMIPIVDAIMRHLESVDGSPEEDSENDDVTVSTVTTTTLPNGDEIFLEDSGKYGQTNGNITTVVFVDQNGVEVKELEQTSDDESTVDDKPPVSSFETCLILAVAYSSAIGGIGTLTGTTTNLVFKQLLTKIYGTSGGVSYATWMMFGIPTMVICVLALCGLLQLFSLGCSVKRESPERKQRIAAMLEKHYDELGSITYHECTVLLCLLLLLLLWFFRTPEFIDGWEDLINPTKVLSDSCPAYVVILLMCILPAKWPIKQGQVTHLVDWEVVEKRIPWDILLLQGGGLAMAAAADSSGLTKLLGTQFAFFNFLPSPVICYIISIITAFMSEIICNSSLAAMLLPVMAHLSEQLHVHPLYLMLPVTFASTLTFTLPIASGPNAIAYKTGKLKLHTMFKTGILSNIITVSIMFMMTNTLGVVIFGLNTYPTWAKNVTETTFLVSSTPDLNNFTDIMT